MSEPIEKQYKILVVDDEQDNLDGFLKVFGSRFNLAAARSGKEALKILESEPKIAVVVTDQRMEEMTGVEVLEAVKTLYPLIVRILITGYSDINVSIDAINKGDVFRYIQKPVDKETTIQILSDGLAKYVEGLQVRASIENTKKRIEQRFLQIYESVAAGIAHHINNGLVPIKTFVSLLDNKIASMKKGQYDSMFFEQFLSQVIVDLKRVETLVQMFLWVRNYKIEDLTREDISGLIEVKDGAVREMLQQKNIQLEKRISEKLPPALVDREKVIEMFAMLVKNAAAVAPEGSTILVEAQDTVQHDGMRYVRVRVKHEGKGYPPEDIPRIFDPFYKFEEKIQKGVSGLELTNCYIIALKHGCEIKVESEPQRDTSFIVDLPTVKVN